MATRNIAQFLGNFIGNQIAAVSSIANVSSLFLHMPEEFEAKIRPYPGGFPVVGSRPNFSPMIFTLDIYDTDPARTSPKMGTSRVALPGSANSTLGGQSPFDTTQSAFGPTRRSLIPPLILLVNPKSMQVTSNKSINESFAKGGWVVEHWGENQDTISMSGETGGFYTGNFLFENKTGLTRLTARNSAAFQNLMALYLIYKNNGYNFEKQYDKRRINSVGTVRIFYDWTTYFGSFRSFKLTEEAEKPFNFAYSFEFVVRKTLRSMRPWVSL